ncbi:MAG TPA: septal ring lytic transglycosylase RlpA family protein [Acetobacteraceae bacterium]|nr:septal ring lytic transglycosylase RlpA family protein [Acetobacteraceae bacterium]
MTHRNWVRYLRPCLPGLLATGLIALTHSAAFAQGASDREAWQPQVGKASFYGRPMSKFRRTASGARFDPEALTAAHPWLPFGTKVRVTVERTGRSVVVTITDRLGNSRRIIDLSVGAARRLGITRQGVVEVALNPA